MNRKQNLLIRHAIGSRLFFDAMRDNASFEVRSLDTDHWTFVVHIKDEEALRNIMQHREELNLFVNELSGDIPIYKWWYYAKDTPKIEYDASSGILFITVDARMGYKV
ncbi:hypothetical protein P9597_03895 [Aneurinibacillus migulanus]|uniref:hypothetical protein n=1 Tax=Aneurinibacillus migulanus TaxID=47500 RepID=UPI002E2482EB|nr:hypothetical protein [Aneurinibacillus migulanus]